MKVTLLVGVLVLWTALVSAQQNNNNNKDNKNQNTRTFGGSFVGGVVGGVGVGVGGGFGPGVGGGFGPGVGGGGFGPGVGGGIVPGVGVGGGFGPGVVGGGLVSPGVGVNSNNCAPSAPTTLRYGCEFYTEDFLGQYVCDRNQKPSYQCPPVRSQCTRFSFGPPQICVTDNDCALNDKCCCDACLGHLVCKAPL